MLKGKGKEKGEGKRERNTLYGGGRGIKSVRELKIVTLCEGVLYLSALCPGPWVPIFDTWAGIRSATSNFAHFLRDEL